MTEILDNFEKKKKKNYSKKGFWQFIIAISAFTSAYIFVYSSSFSEEEIGVNFRAFLLTVTSLSFPIFTFLGFISSIKSYTSKEPASIRKYIGITGNTLLFCVLLIYFLNNYKPIIKLLTSPPIQIESIE